MSGLAGGVIVVEVLVTVVVVEVGEVEVGVVVLVDVVWVVVIEDVVVELVEVVDVPEQPASRPTQTARAAMTERTGNSFLLNIFVPFFQYYFLQNNGFQFVLSYYVVSAILSLLSEREAQVFSSERLSRQWDIDRIVLL